LINDRKSETRATRRGIRERLEQAFDLVLGHPESRIFEYDPHTAVRDGFERYL
jgi:hypothetical protein